MRVSDRVELATQHLGLHDMALYQQQLKLLRDDGNDELCLQRSKSLTDASTRTDPEGEIELSRADSSVRRSVQGGNFSLFTSLPLTHFASPTIQTELDSIGHT